MAIDVILLISFAGVQVGTPDDVDRQKLKGKEKVQKEGEH